MLIIVQYTKNKSGCYLAVSMLPIVVTQHSETLQERAMLLNQVLSLVNPLLIFHPIRRKERAIYSLDVHSMFIRTLRDERDGLVIYKQN